MNKLRTVQILSLYTCLKFIEFLGEYNLKYYALAGTVLGSVRHKGFIPWDTDIDLGVDRETYEKIISLKAELVEYGLVLDCEDTNPNCRSSCAKIRLLSTKFHHKNDLSLSDEFSGIYVDLFPLDNRKSCPGKCAIVTHKLYKILRKVNLIQRGKEASYKQINSYLHAALISAAQLIPESLLGFGIRITRSLLVDKNGAYVTNLESKYGISKQTMSHDIYGEGVALNFEGFELIVPEKYEDWLTKIYINYSTKPKVTPDVERLLNNTFVDFGNFEFLESVTEESAHAWLKSNNGSR